MERLKWSRATIRTSQSPKFKAGRQQRNAGAQSRNSSPGYSCSNNITYSLIAWASVQVQAASSHVGGLKTDPGLQLFAEVRSLLKMSRKLKVRTGCITCKIRKVKCDEGKPWCRRCTDTGRKCDGYRVSKELMSRPKKLPFLVKLSPTTDASALSGDLCGDEKLWVHHFSHHAGPALSGPADRDFWSQMLPQLALREAPVRWAMLAFSASYCRTEAMRTDNAPTIPQQISIQYYCKAITSLQRHINERGGDIEVPLACCLLFCCLELLYVDRLRMLEQLQNGLKILDSMPSHDRDGPFIALFKQKLRQIFTRLDGQSTLLGKSASAAPNAIQTTASREAFADLFEAKEALDDLSSRSLNFVRHANDTAVPGSEWPTVSQSLAQSQLHEQLLIWRLRLDKTVSLGGDDRAAKLLQIQGIASFIYLSACFQPSEMLYDAYWLEFSALIRMAESVLAESSLPSFSIEVNIVLPLYLTAYKCRDPQLRRKAIDLLQSFRGREGMWDSMIHGRIARRIVEIEESGMLIANGGPVLTQWPEEQFRVTEVEIHRVPGEASLAKLVFTVAGNTWDEKLLVPGVAKVIE